MKKIILVLALAIGPSASFACGPCDFDEDYMAESHGVSYAPVDAELPDVLSLKKFALDCANAISVVCDFDELAAFGDDLFDWFFVEVSSGEY